MNNSGIFFTADGFFIIVIGASGDPIHKYKLNDWGLPETKSMEDISNKEKKCLSCHHYDKEGIFPEDCHKLKEIKYCENYLK